MLITLRTRLLAASPDFVRSAWMRIEASPIGYRLAKGAFWALVGAVISRGLGIVSSIVIARLLGKKGFGELGIIQSTVGVFGAVAAFGLGMAATKYIAEFRGTDSERAGRVITLSAIISWVTGILTGSILFLAADWLAVHSLQAPQLAIELRIAAILILFESVNAAQTGALAGFESYKRIAQLGILTGLASFVLVPGGCFLFGLPGAVAGLAATQALGCVLNRWALSVEAERFGVPIWSGSWRFELPVLWKFSLPAVLATLLVTPTLWYCQTMLVRQPSGYQGMAEFAVGSQWRSLVVYLPVLLCTAYLPVFSSLSAPRDHEKRKNLLWAALGITGGLTLIVALPIILAAPWVLAAYGPGFGSAKWVLAVMLLAGAADSANGILVRSLMAVNQAWIRLVSNGAWAAIQIVTALALVPRYGALGLAMSVCAAQIVHLAIQTPLTMFLCFRKPKS